jgi:hypothetical protein
MNAVRKGTPLHMNGGDAAGLDAVDTCLDAIRAGREDAAGRAGCAACKWTTIFLDNGVEADRFIQWSAPADHD